MTTGSHASKPASLRFLNPQLIFKLMLKKATRQGRNLCKRQQDCQLTFGRPWVIEIFSPSLGLDGAALCSSVILEQQKTNQYQPVRKKKDWHQTLVNDFRIKKILQNQTYWEKKCQKFSHLYTLNQKEIR